LGPGRTYAKFAIRIGWWGRADWLPQKLDVESLAKQLEEELAGRDVDAVVRTVRKEINEKIKEHYLQTFLLNTNVLIAAVRTRHVEKLL
jgi:hypothetical protein